MPAQYPNNLENIFSSSDPIAMQFARDQQANAIYNDQLDQQRQTLANQFTEQVNPIKVKQEQAALDTTNAQLPGVQADATLKQINARVAGQTEDSDIKAKIAKNFTSMSDDQVKQIGNLGQSMLQIADLADSGQMPPLEIQKSLPPEVLQLLSTPQGRAELRRKGKAVVMHSADYLQKKALEDARNASQERIHAGNNATSIRVAEINASRPRGGAGGVSWEERFKKADTPQKRMTVYSSAAMEAENAAASTENPQEKAQYLEIAKQYQAQAADAQRQYEVELQAKWRAGIDPAATATTGRIVGTTPPKFDTANKPDPLGIRK